MEKSNNNYILSSLMLTTIGTVLTTQQVDYFLDIIILSIAVAVGIAGATKVKRKCDVK